MRTRAISVIVERSPGGGNAYHVQVAGKAQFLIRTSQAIAIEFASLKLGLLGADAGERARVTGLLERELARLTRAEVTAEVPVSEERRAA